MQYQVQSYTATIFCGLRPGYNGSPFPLVAAENIVRNYCDTNDIGVTFTPTTFIYKGGDEPGIIVGLVNYPRNPKPAVQIERHAKALARALKDGLGQERVSIVFPDQTVMIGDK